MSNGKITVNARMDANYDNRAEFIFRWYADDKSNKMLETRSITCENDFFNGKQIRESDDNGRTWSEYREVYEEDFTKVGEKDEILKFGFDPYFYDTKSGNLVTCGLFRYFIGGHEEAYRKYWREASDETRDHCYLVYRRPDGTLKQQLIQYDGGVDYDPENPLNPEFMDKNLCYNSNIHIASNGDLLFAIGADVRACCRILGLSLEEVFPSCPKIMCGVILVRAHWDAENEKYNLSYSKPVVISDLLSSRGVCEPSVCELSSGRIVIVFRGSNVMRGGWHTRISPYAPGFKWYLYSDDGGKTFTPAMPWHFDTREVVYSSATIHDFFKSSKTGKNYWIGNITDPTKTYANNPRWPLYICEVDERYGCLKKDTLTVIDTLHEGESELTELSNFTMIENRETGNLEIRLAKTWQKSPTEKDYIPYSESWTYEISFE